MRLISIISLCLLLQLIPNVYAVNATNYQELVISAHAASSGGYDDPFKLYSLTSTMRAACVKFQEDEIAVDCYYQTLLNLDDPTETTEMIRKMCQDPDFRFSRRCYREAFEEYNHRLLRFPMAEAILNGCNRSIFNPPRYESMSRCYLAATIASGSNLLLVVREACKEASNPQQMWSCFTRALSNFPSDGKRFSSGYLQSLAP